MVVESKWQVYRFGDYCVTIVSSKNELKNVLYKDIACADGKATVPSDKLIPLNDFSQCFN